MGLNFFSTNNLVADKGNPVDAKVEVADPPQEGCRSFKASKGEAVTSSCNALVTQKMQYHRLAQGGKNLLTMTI
jgi:hypothetical protein